MKYYGSSVQYNQSREILKCTCTWAVNRNCNGDIEGRVSEYRAVQ